MFAKTASVTRQQFLTDLLRPQYHFLPPSNWMNDPNGLIQWQGKYHLFYQHNPTGPLWGYMSWGHASSDDLIHWTDLPLAIVPTPGGPDEVGCFSGCAVNNNGQPTLVYTAARGEKYEIQTQCIAIGDETLLNWQKYAGNPVLAQVPSESGQTSDFRDPYVWKEADAWYMVIASRIKDVGGVIFLYKSDDLLNWEYLHPLLIGDKQRNGDIWECPNFFKLGDQWVLIVSSHVTVATDTVLYFVGTYDNHQFTPIYEGVLDYGELYAPLTTIDDQNRRLLIGWLREARSSQEQQLAGWSGVQSIPRILTLSNNRLLMTPIPALQSIRGKHHHYTPANLLDNGFLDVNSLSLDIEAEFVPQPASNCGLSLVCSPDDPARIDILYESASQRLVIRNIASQHDSSLSHAENNRHVDKNFGFEEQVDQLTTHDQQTLTVLTQSIPHALAPDERLQLRILLDGSVVEIIANNRISLTYRIYRSNAQRNHLQLIGEKSLVQTLDIWEMPSIWQ
ncbi:MAG: glycoside hydrolase family 32 protein [Anaerolineae bacterium]|nr:glycoside hydrolase family 32 protein [Anaerolineae bacterium]